MRVVCADHGNTPFIRDHEENLKMSDYIVAINDKRPEQAGFRVFAYLNVPHAGMEPVLTRPAAEITGNCEVLQLDYVEHATPALQVVTRKLCVFECKRGCSADLLLLNTQGGQYRMPIITVDQ